jgi:hypothetical protein
VALNRMCSAHKGTNEKSRENYDRIFRKNETEVEEVKEDEDKSTEDKEQ